MPVQDIATIELHNLLNEQQRIGDPFRKTLQLIDVRERHEVEAGGKIAGAYNIPFSVYENDRETFVAAFQDLTDKHSRVVVYCRSGRRSRIVAEYVADRLGYEDIYDMPGGLLAWGAAELPVQAHDNDHSPWVHVIFEKDTGTAQYIVADIISKEAYIIDPVLDYDPLEGKVKSASANLILDHIEKFNLQVTKIIDSHVHADHLTAALYLKHKLGSKNQQVQPEFWIGSNVTEVQKVFGKTYNLPETAFNTEHFDRLVTEGDTWVLGKDIQCSAISTPGHTPACMSYRIGDTAFVGDTLFMPDLGTARCDFPGGSANELYSSIHKMYSTWPDDTRIHVGHDYPPAGSGRQETVMTTLLAQKKCNKMVNENVSREEFTKMRSQRDSSLKAPRYIHPSLQTNLRGGHLPEPELSVDGAMAGSFFKIPIRFEA